MAITITTDSATISTTEYFLASDSTTATYQTADCYLYVFLDLSNLAGGDTFVVKFYEKTNGGTARKYMSTLTYSGVQDPPTVKIDGGVVGEGWEIGIAKTAGTDRVVAWSLRTVS